MTSFRGYGENGDGGENGQKKRITIIAVSSLILLAMVVAVATGVSKSRNGSPDVSSPGGTANIVTSNKAITAICQPTDYKDTCVTGLTAAGGSNTTDPKELVKLSFQIVIDHIHAALNQSTLLKEAASDPRTKAAVENCGELMDYAVDDLKKSIDHVSAIDLASVEEFVEDLKVWLSAAITYEETCFDGFENTSGDTGEKMRNLLRNVTELTTNTLAIVDEISSILSSLDISTLLHRRLMSATPKPVVSSDGFPSWMPPGKRRLLQAPTSTITPDVTVAKDGSGQFTTVGAAITAAPRSKNNQTYVIYVKAGVYQESIAVPRNFPNLMLMGDGPTKSKITNNKNWVDGTPTFKTATAAIMGDGFVARDIGFENSAGAIKHQAVAIRVQSDRSIFYNCQMDGYQDTLYAHTKRQFYRDCTISGTIDFMFGDSSVIFQNCLIVVRKPLDNQQNTVTAQGRNNSRETTGMILHNCTLVADEAYYPVRNKLPTYLGRPWKLYSRCYILQSWMDDLIQPDGWQPWYGDFALDTLDYAEFDNRGPGSVTTGRVKWKGLKSITADTAQQYSVSTFIAGDTWIKAAGVPYTGGLLPIGYSVTPVAAHSNAPS